MQNMSWSVDLVVRNTFVHFTQGKANDSDDPKRCGRSSSAPPACRQGENDEGAFDSAANSEPQAKSETGDFESNCSTTCETLLLDASTTANAENADDYSPMVSCERAHFGDHDTAAFQTSAPELSATVGQQQVQLEEMSQMVEAIWTKLRSIEAHCADTVAAAAPQSEKQAMHLPAHMVYTPASGQFGSGQQMDITAAHAYSRLDIKAPAYLPSCSSCLPSPEAAEIRSLIASAEQMLKLVPGVAGAEASLGPAGTLATISIELLSSTAKSALLESVIAAAKLTFLELAANSQTV